MLCDNHRAGRFAFVLCGVVGALLHFFDIRGEGGEPALQVVAKAGEFFLNRRANAGFGGVGVARKPVLMLCLTLPESRPECPRNAATLAHVSEQTCGAVSAGSRVGGARVGCG